MNPELRLDVGDVMHLQAVSEEQGLRYAVKVIGYLPGESLLVTAPRTRAGVVLTREGQPFHVRVLVDSRVYGFTTHVLKSNGRPYPYLHLSYPRELQSVVVRKAPRAVADVIVSIRQTSRDEPATARLLDISTTGARLSAPTPIGQMNDEIDIAVRLTIGDLEEYLRLPSCIRRVQVDAPEGKPDAPLHLYGVEFQPLPQPVRLALYAYVYSRLAE
jgi:c-di-GMP-binding flagellar brake protein YcgR